MINTYNHALFIRQAVESIFDQVVDFPVELIIVDDSSTDQTVQVIAELQPPPWLRLEVIVAQSNRNDNSLLVEAVARSTGRYIATMDGDDYLTSPHKLAVQSEFLDENPDYAGVSHALLSVTFPEGEVLAVEGARDRDITLEDLIFSNEVPASSLMTRREVYSMLPPDFRTAVYGDWPRNIAVARLGRIRHSSEVMGVYRRHDGGVWSAVSLETQLRNDISFLQNLDPAVVLGRTRSCARSRNAKRGKLIRLLVKDHRWSEALSVFVGAVQHDGVMCTLDLVKPGEFARNWSSAVVGRARAKARRFAHAAER